MPPCLLAGIVADEKSAVFLILYGTCLFFLWMLWRSFYADFEQSDSDAPWFCFFMFLVLEVKLLWSVNVWVSLNLGNFQSLFFQNFFSVLFLLSLSSHWGTQTTSISGQSTPTDELYLSFFFLRFILDSFYCLCVHWSFLL